MAAERTARTCAPQWADMLLCVCAVFGFCSLALASDLPSHANARVQPIHRILTTARQVHCLSAPEAAQAFPVRLRGVVTFYDPYQEGHKALFIADATGSIFVAPGEAKLPPLHAGSVVVVDGVTDPGGFAPIVSNPQIRLLPGSLPLPKPVRGELPLLLTGTEDGQWVEIEGIVHAVEVDGKHVVLTVATADGTLTATSIKEPEANYSALVDAKVTLRGVAAPLVDGKRRMIGVRILFPGMSTVFIKEPAPGDPFALPIQHLASLFQYSPTAQNAHRIHIRGIVTLAWPGERVCIAERNDGLCIQSRQTLHLHEGQVVDAVGFLERENYLPGLSDAVLRPVGIGKTILPTRISSDEVYSGDHDGQLTQIEGAIVAKDVIGHNTTLLLSSRGVLFPALLPSNSLKQSGHSQPQWIMGSEVVVTGILSGKVDAHLVTRREGLVRLESFQILMRSPADVEIVELPSWWDRRHALTVLGCVGSLTLAILCWVVALRRQVHQQTMIIRQSAEEFRHRAEHDTLTGLFVRRVFYERLDIAIKEARLRSASMALMMIDVDEFKQLNDSLGHAAGDAVLCAVAQRMHSAVRETDTVARMGGDEFAIFLAGVHGIEEASTIAAKLLQAISAPLSIGEDSVGLSISIGVTAYPEGGLDSASLLKSADIALYKAKAMGRNCYQTFSVDMSSPFPLKHRIQPA